MSNVTDPKFDRIYELYERPILAYCLRRTSRDHAQEAINEVFTVAWRRLADMPSGDRALPWLYGVARRVLSHQRRAANRSLRLAGKVASQPHSEPPGTESIVVQRHEYETVCQAVEQLRPEDREMLLLSAWEGLTHAEIANSMGYSLAAVDKRLARAKQRLRRQYDAMYATGTHRPPASTAKGGDGA
ncbi:MAG: sigma-70 family RNA polymerase sigma factor [bacterium]|nr:sigma-70 family RNA polymerase sigma factor [bacterium]